MGGIWGLVQMAVGVELPHVTRAPPLPLRPARSLSTNCPPPQVHIEPGHRHGSKIVFRGEAGSDSPDVAPGDLIFILEQKEHAEFKRIGSDLFYERTVRSPRGATLRCRVSFMLGRGARGMACCTAACIADMFCGRPPARARQVSLVEALTGARFHIKSLDDRVLDVSSGGGVIRPDSWMVVRGEGMPIHGRPFEKGNLYIHFNGERGRGPPTPRLPPAAAWGHGRAALEG